MTQTGSFELWERTVRNIIRRPTRTLSLLDLCCNEGTVTRRLECKRHTGVDLIDRETRSATIDFRQEDVLLHCRKLGAKAYDLCICSDGIEHLLKEDGRKLLDEMLRVARLAIVFTPLGDMMSNPANTHPDDHRSAWLPEDLTAVGWHTIVFPNWHPSWNMGAFFAWKGAL